MAGTLGHQYTQRRGHKPLIVSVNSLVKIAWMNEINNCGLSQPNYSYLLQIWV